MATVAEIECAIGHCYNYLITHSGIRLTSSIKRGKGQGIEPTGNEDFDNFQAIMRVEGLVCSTKRIDIFVVPRTSETCPAPIERARQRNSAFSNFFSIFPKTNILNHHLFLHSKMYSAFESAGDSTAKK